MRILTMAGLTLMLMAGAAYAQTAPGYGQSGTGGGYGGGPDNYNGPINSNASDGPIDSNVNLDTETGSPGPVSGQVRNSPEGMPNSDNSGADPN